MACQPVDFGLNQFGTIKNQLWACFGLVCCELFWIYSNHIRTVSIMFVNIFVYSIVLDKQARKKITVSKPKQAFFWLADRFILVQTSWSYGTISIYCSTFMYIFLVYTVLSIRISFYYILFKVYEYLSSMWCDVRSRPHVHVFHHQ